MTEEELQKTLAELHVQSVALKTLLIVFIGIVAKRDRMILEELLDSIPAPAPPGVTPLNEAFEAYALALKDIESDIRNALVRK